MNVDKPFIGILDYINGVCRLAEGRELISSDVENQEFIFNYSKSSSSLLQLPTETINRINTLWQNRRSSSVTQQNCDPNNLLENERCHLSAEEMNKK